MTTGRKTRINGSAKQASDQDAAAPTRLAQIVGLLSRAEGASLAELAAATGWQPHSVRGALAGALKRKGHEIRSEKIDGVWRYRLGGTR